MPKSKRTSAKLGLFIVGSDTDVGKTVVASCMARQLVREGLRVGVYKPVASGCERVRGELISSDAVSLWEAAGKPGDLEAVCPQRFAAPMAPYLAARKEKRSISARQLVDGFAYWQKQSDIVLVEGAGGLLSPLTESETVADLAVTLGLPLVVVVANKIGMLNQALMTVTSATHLAVSLSLSALVVNDCLPVPEDPTLAEVHRALLRSNPEELQRILPSIPQTRLKHSAKKFSPALDWAGLAKKGLKRS